MDPSESYKLYTLRQKLNIRVYIYAYTNKLKILI